MNNEETKVRVALGYTLNLGNFQSLRIDVEVQDNKREGENTNDAFDPSNATDISSRFGKPTSYNVRILSTSYD